ncbi:conserved hypothetical protein [Gammaproteobacteria bacterium]
MFNQSTYTRRMAKYDTFMSIERIKEIAPAIFAETPHQSRSERYGFVPTEILLKGMETEGFLPVSVTQASSRRENGETAAKHLIRFRHQSIQPVQGLFPEIILLNSHDGSTQYHLMTGIYRQICTNGMIAGDIYGDCKVPHKAGALDRVIEGSYEIVKETPRLLDAVAEMQGTNLSTQEIKVFARAALALKYEPSNKDEAPITIDQINQARRIEDNGSDIWRTFNRAQENLIRGGLSGYRRDENGRHRRTTTREIKAVGQTVSINRGLWVLAEEMKKIKNGAIDLAA